MFLSTSSNAVVESGVRGGIQQQEEGEQNRKEGGLEEQAWPVHLVVGPSSWSTSESQEQSHLKLCSVPFGENVSNPEKTFTLKWILSCSKSQAALLPPTPVKRKQIHITTRQKARKRS